MASPFPARRPVALDDLADLAYDERGLIPVVAQDRVTGAVLMLAWANRETLARSLETGRMTYWSRSRQALWAKGETSGNTQQLVALAADCDRDALLAIVEQTGAACHTGDGSCWSEAMPTAGFLGELERLIAARKTTPAGGYTDSLLADPDLAAAKVEEEAAEVGAVVRGEPNDDSLEHEAADLMYHLIAAMAAAGSSWRSVLDELRARH